MWTGTAGHSRRTRHQPLSALSSTGHIKYSRSQRPPVLSAGTLLICGVPEKLSSIALPRLSFHALSYPAKKLHLIPSAVEELSACRTFRASFLLPFLKDPPRSRDQWGVLQHQTFYKPACILSSARSRSLAANLKLILKTKPRPTNGNKIKISPLKKRTFSVENVSCAINLLSEDSRPKALK